MSPNLDAQPPETERPRSTGRAFSAVIAAKSLRWRTWFRPSLWCCCWYLCFAAGAELRAAEATRTASQSETTWQAARSALAEMPLPLTPSLARSNAIRLIVHAFKSNAVVRALIVLPGAVDDFHLIHRDVPLPALNSRNLAEALASLTNASQWRITFSRSFLLVHTAADRLTAEVRIVDSATRDRLQSRMGESKLEWVDAPWPKAHPILRKAIGLGLQPAADSPNAGHFERLNLAAAHLTDLELVEAVALSTGTRLSVERRRVQFERP